MSLQREPIPKSNSQLLAAATEAVVALEGEHKAFYQRLVNFMPRVNVISIAVDTTQYGKTIAEKQEL